MLSSAAVRTGRWPVKARVTKRVSTKLQNHYQLQDALDFGLLKHFHQSETCFNGLTPSVPLS